MGFSEYRIVSSHGVFKITVAKARLRLLKKYIRKEKNMITLEQTRAGGSFS